MQTPRSDLSTINISKGNDKAQVIEGIQKLIGENWEFNHTLNRLEKGFFFRSPEIAKKFLDAVYLITENLNHHPTLTWNYTMITLQWTTHRPKGMSLTDIIAAQNSDKVASEIGTVEEDKSKKCGAL